MKIYLASPFFNEDELIVYTKVIDSLRSQGHELFVPQEHKVDNEWELTNLEWASLVFKIDLEAVHECDIVVALNWGLYSDSGTAWECGYASALGLKVIQIIMNKDIEHSLMMISGAYKTFYLNDLLSQPFEQLIKQDGCVTEILQK